MKSKLRYFQIVIIVFISLIFSGPSGIASNKKKFIELGWDIPNTAFLKKNYNDMERMTPFDGVIFYVEARSTSGKKVSSQSVWDATEWKKEWFSNAVDDLRTCKFTRFTDNFLRFNATPGNLDWNDDKGWGILCEKAQICAWICRQGKAKGLCIDYESYGEKQFKFSPLKGLSFQETTKFARKRGRDFISAIAKEMPDAVILTLWLNSINFKAGSLSDPDSFLSGEEYGLLPAFVDGMLDGLPPQMIVVDGCESGYYMDSAEEYLSAANNMRSWNGAAINLVSPENRRKYLSQVQAGFGFYLDMYLNNEGSRYYFPPLDGSRLKRLYRNLLYALNATDEYVWIYGEQCRWWNEPPSPAWTNNLSKTVGKGRLWEEAMHGITKTIWWIKNPVELAQKQLAESKGAITNIALNGDFTEKATDKNSKLPLYFSVWQDEKNKTGEFCWDDSVGNGSGRAKKVMWGCFLYKIEVQPGDIYYVSAECLPVGNTQPSLMIRWQTADNKWTKYHLDQYFTFTKTQANWQKAAGVVTVPQDVSKMVILLNVKSQLNDSDVCWFDNLKIYKLPPLF